MSDLESNLSALVAKVSQLEKQQVSLKRYVVKLKHTLDEQIENFNHRPEIQDIENLQKNFVALTLRLDELLALNNPIKSTTETQDKSPDNWQKTEEYQNQLVFNRTDSRDVLIEALETAQARLIIVCPWLNFNSIDEHLLKKLKNCLNRNCQIDIGWGYLGDRLNIGKGWKYNALRDLQDLEESYPGLFRLKLLGTHENFLVCDERFAFVGSHNFLASGNQSLEREVGVLTSDSEIIQGLINRFDDGEGLDEVEINRRFAASVKSLDEVEYLPGVIDESEMEFRDFSMVVGEDEEEEEEVEYLPGVVDENEMEFQDISMMVDEDEQEEEEEEESQEPVVSAEEFLRRYSEGERDFTGINLSGVDLSGKSFSDSKLNLSNANFNGANLSGADLRDLNLTGAKFQSANLSEIKLYSANLSQTKFINSNLNKANLYNTKLEKAKFRNVNLSEANLESANFTEANLSGVNFSNSQLSNDANFSSANLKKANLSRLNLRNANFTNADLSQADLSKVNLLNAKFEGAKLQMVTMNQALCSETTVFPKGFNFTKLGVYFIAPAASLSEVNLAGRDLSHVHLREANLQGANLN
ncbi:pentapeptide repeat-containing protein [Okeania sp. KiyG1]|uniref:pentapeptide repeat-containing protein n=1 Tax=Okeania sp. KiyG1 TaxID=2720165 RepID=UPI001923B6E7|nr:pentapeptide repeat-containing protein [Okeania sp. KiyG1]GGA28430.1 hypothetical protein CYANOKiyG1_44650 [Okeania sp. KiyG1]